VGGGVNRIIAQILSTAMVMLTLLAIVAMLPVALLLGLLNQEKNQNAG
jgi:hypothetical protein